MVRVEDFEILLIFIGHYLEEWNLRTSDDNSFAQVFEHKGEGRRRVGHCVSSVKDNEAIEVMIRML